MKYYLNNSYSQMQACSGGQVTLKCPEKLYLDITQDCNLYCRMCRDSLQMTGKTMPFDLFCRLVDETAPYVKCYSFYNWGEPLVVEDFRQRVEYVNAVKRPDCAVEISTNGMLLSDEMIGFLHTNGVDVIVSFDGADRETFEGIRCGSDFGRICNQLRKLAAAYAEKPPHRQPRIYTSIQRDNQGQLLKIAQLAHSLGIRRMGFGLVTSPLEYAPDMGEELRAEIEETSAYLDSHKMLNDLYPTRVGDYLWWGNQYSHRDGFILDNRCNAPFVSATIAYNGDVFLCCNVGEFVDNVSDESFLALWQSGRYDDLRAAVNDGDAMPDRCRHCWWVNR